MLRCSSLHHSHNTCLLQMPRSADGCAGCEYAGLLPPRGPLHVLYVGGLWAATVHACAGCGALGSATARRTQQPGHRPSPRLLTPLRRRLLGWPARKRLRHLHGCAQGWAGRFGKDQKKEHGEHKARAQGNKGEPCRVYQA